MTHYDIFRGQLGVKYPSYGHALWEPSPSGLNGPVEVGDVGFIREGRFHRLFNALLRADDSSHEFFGVPEYHEPLIPKLTGHVFHGTLSPGHYFSVGVDMIALEQDVKAGPDDFPKASFSCKDRRGGAVLSLPIPAQRQDTIAREAFGKWMVAHIDRWFEFARQLELGIEQMEELILVTGCDRARSWTNVAFLKNQLDAEVSFGVEVTHSLEDRISWQVSPEQNRGAVLNKGPSGKNLPENQCIFIRGFRVARTLGIFPKRLKGAAQPSTNGDGDDWDSGPSLELISIPTIPKYQDPLHFIFNYVAERSPDCDMVLVHDVDLARISRICDGNSLETLQPDVVEKHLQSSNAEIHTDVCCLSPANNDEPQIVRVAMLMITHEPNVSPQSPPATLGCENVDFHHPIQYSVINPHGLKGCEDDSNLRGSLVRPDMSGHRYSYSTQNTTQHQVISVDTSPVPRPISLLDFPPELMTHILLYLSPLDIISCRRTCHMLYNVCSDSAALRYLVQMERCAVSDDMSPGLHYPERLRILEEREKAWEMLDFRKFMQISVPLDLSADIYDFNDGAFFLSTSLECSNIRTKMGYSYVTLPPLSSKEDQKLEWKKFSLETEMLIFGLAVYEHDLIAVLTTKENVRHRSDRTMNLEIRFLTFSTGHPHPLAEQPVIFIARKKFPLGIYSLRIEIVGDFLILLIIFEERSGNENMFVLVRWKKGETYCLRSPAWGTCARFSFLSQDTLVISNLIQNTLEVAKIVTNCDDAPHLVPLCMLHLPPLSRGASPRRIFSRTEPRPTGSSPVTIPPPSDRPFRDKGEDAIIIFNILYRHFSGMDRLTFIVHRRALLAHIPAEHRACVPFSSAPGLTSTPVQVPWSAWGPTVTRWFEGDNTSTCFITRAAGQRTVTLENRTPTPIIVRDFNPYAVRAARALASTNGQLKQGNWSKELPNGNQMTLNVEDSVLTAGSIFKEDVRSSLPYIEIRTQDEYDYEGVVIDDERILGLKSRQESEHWVPSFDIHILG